jgi:hypothetical protein
MDDPRGNPETPLPSDAAGSTEGTRTGPEASPRPWAVPWSRWVLFWSLALLGATFDLTTKAVVFEKVGPPALTEAG